MREVDDAHEALVGPRGVGELRERGEIVEHDGAGAGQAHAAGVGARISGEVERELDGVLEAGHAQGLEAGETLAREVAGLDDHQLVG